MAVAGTTPIAVLFYLPAARTIPLLWDRCVTWSFTGRAERFLERCPQGRTGIPETRIDFIFLSLAMPALMLLVALLGLVSAYRSQRGVVLCVGLVFLLLTVPMVIGNFGIATLIAAICFLISSALIRL